MSAAAPHRPRPAWRTTSPLLDVNLSMRLFAVIATTAALAGCGSAKGPSSDPIAQPGRPEAPIAAQGAQPGTDSRVDSAEGPAPLQSNAATPTATPLQDGRDWSERQLAPRDDPDSYAGREDARRLALELAARHSLDADWVVSVLAQARLKEGVQRLMMPAPSPTAKNWSAYRGRFIEPQRIKAGSAFWRKHRQELERAETEYGVPGHIVAGVIGVETLYGRDTGRHRVLDALTTLALDFPKGRSDRSAFFRQELGEFLLLCKEQGLEPTAVLGSYAGAIGWPQFMPSSIRRHAVDFDGDGRIDLINSPVDAIGSVARFLASHGWRPTWPTHFDVRPPQAGPGLATLLAPDIRPTFSPEQMGELGAELPAAAREHPGPLALVLLHNAGQAPTLVAGTTNFYAITRYNQSSYYALAVIQLGEAVSREVASARARP